MSFKETKTEVLEVEGGIRLLARIWLPEKKPKAIFLAIHGGMAHGGDWVTPALYFKEKGIATMTLDLRGHGTYTDHNEKGKLLLHIDSFDDYIKDNRLFLDWIKEKYPKVPIFILGHSLGGLISIIYGLKEAGGDEDIKGFVVSAPWLKNLVETPAILTALSKLFSIIYPTFSVEPDLSLDVLTHDPKITKRHYEDQEKGLRGTRATARFAVEAEKAQDWANENISKWEKYPLYVVLAGQDKLADSDHAQEVLSKIPSELLTLTRYEENFHENFNELNREDIFSKIHDWMLPLVK